MIQYDKDDMEIGVKTDRELLIQSVVLLNRLNSDFKEFIAGPGASRCVLHGEKVGFLEQRLKWLNRTAVGAIVMLILTAAIEWFKN